MERIDPTTPLGVHQLSVDFTDLLPVGVTLTSAVIVVKVLPGSKAPDATPQARVGAPSISGNTAFVTFTNGLADVVYVVEFSGTFSTGEKESVNVMIAVGVFV